MQGIVTAQNQLRQILSDNKACKNSGCACCAHWNTTVCRLLTLLGTVLDTFQIAVAARNRLLQEMANLKRQLLLYDNPNTPSSQKRISHKKQRMTQNGSDNVAKRLVGAQPGHNKTAERLPIDGEEHHRCSNCPGCHGEDLTEYGTEEFVITDIPRIVKAVTIRHHVHMYRCNRCGREGIKPKTARRAEDAGRMTGRQPDTAEQAPRERAAVQRDAVQGRRSVVHIPRSGTYGLNVLAAILFNFMDRLPNGLNVASMGRIGLRIFTGTVHNILYRIGTDLDPPSRQILKRIREGLRAARRRDVDIPQRQAGLDMDISESGDRRRILRDTAQQGRRCPQGGAGQVVAGEARVRRAGAIQKIRNCSPHIIRQTINVSSIGRRLDTKLHEQMKICVNSMLCLMARPQIHLPNVKTCLDVVNTYKKSIVFSCAP